MSEIELTGEIEVGTSEEQAYARTNSRIDNIIAHNNDTEGNTELVDIRTGADNIVYNSAGQAVRGQIEDIYSEMDSKSPIWFDEEQGNLYNYKDDTYGYYINYQNGEIISQTGYYVTDYIEVLPRKTIYKNYNGFGAFYDEEKHYISGHEYDVQSCIVPTHAKYYRTAFSTAQQTTAYVSYKNEYTPYTGESAFNVTNTDFVNWLNNRYQAINAHNNDTEGNSELIDIRVGADGTVYSSAGQAVRSQFDSIEPYKFFTEIPTGNLYNYANDTYGYFINSQNGELRETTGYWATDYIEVIPGKTIYKSNKGYGAFYDSDKNFISSHDFGVLSAVVPGTAKYYKTAFQTDKRTTAYVSYTNEYTPYTGESAFNVTNTDFVNWLNNRYQAINAHNQRYAGKKIAVLGDSWSDTSNNTCTKRWHDWIAEKTGAVIQCAAVSGTGYKRGTGNEYTTSNFMQQALTVDSDTDLVIIFGSGNDCGTSETANYDFGTAKDKTADTLGGCMNITLDNIQSTAPNARILVLSPAPWINYDPWWEGAATGRMGVYTELMKNVAAYRGIRFKDMYHSSDMHPQNTDFKAAFYNSDGVHPNDAGQKRMYPDILAEIKAVLPESE